MAVMPSHITIEGEERDHQRSESEDRMGTHEATLHKTNSSTNLLRNETSLITSADQMSSLQQISQILSEQRQSNTNSINNPIEVQHNEQPRRRASKAKKARAAVTNAAAKYHSLHNNQNQTEPADYGVADGAGAAVYAQLAAAGTERQSQTFSAISF